jgi:magnesium transporter
VSLVRDSQLGIGRIVPYVTAVADWMPKGLNARLKTISRDVSSLNEFVTHLTDKVQFVLDATLGLINIAQNDLMKVLTIVSVIGIPPTLIAGVYGMNFAHMPELHWQYGYEYGLGIILVTAIAPLFWFRKKGWL